MQTNRPTLIAVSVDRFQREPYISPQGGICKSAVIKGASQDPEVSFEMKTGPLSPEQVHRCELLQRHGCTIVELPNNWKWGYDGPGGWQEIVINAAMERVSKLYGAGREVGMTEAYDSTFAEQVLAEINRNFPHAVQKSELKYAFENEPSDSALLTALAGLQRDGFIEGKTMFSSTSGRRELTAMADIQITAAGRKHLSDISAQPPADARNLDRQINSPRRTAEVLNILIASPSDVVEERAIVESAIHDWNASHFSNTGIMLNAIKWESHAYPASGARPQAIINEQIVESGDILIAIFGYKLGTPTGTAQSGTIEEIEKFRKAGKYVALYFSTANIPRTADREQLEALEGFKRDRQKDTLYFEFEDASGLRNHLTRHLPKIIHDVREKLNLGSPQRSVIFNQPLLARSVDVPDEHSALQGRASLADIDGRVLEALGDRALWTGARPMTGAGEPAVRSSEIAQLLSLDTETIADSLERLESKGRVKNAGGTMDNPAPYWFIVRR